MRTASLNTAFTQLTKAMKALHLRWQETTPHWSDSVRREFEEGFLADLEGHIHKTSEEMDRLDKVMVQAQQECS